ncbi:MAG: hypothetical protein F4W92_03795 [Gammaproteobacteria bacterium]|nr:hypothetical protein [Gammaproteobacteria bacterium]
MNRSFRIYTLLLTLSIALGGGGVYLLHVIISNNTPSKFASATTNPINNAHGSGDRFQLSLENYLNLHGNYPSSVSLTDPILNENSFKLRLAVYSFVAGLSDQDLTIELQAITGRTRGLSHAVRDILQTALVEKLAIFNPKAAVEYVIEQGKNRIDSSGLSYGQLGSYTDDETVYLPVVQSVFAEWASVDLNSAVEGAKTLEVDTKSNALSGILATQAGQSVATYRRIALELGDGNRGIERYLMSLETQPIEDIQATWHEVATLINPEQKIDSRTFEHILRHWYDQEGIEVLKEIYSSTLDENIKFDTIQQLLLLAAESNPKQTFEYVETILNDGLNFSHLYTVASAWATTDPLAAYKVVSNIEQIDQRETLQGSVVLTWARTKPRYVLRNLANFPTKFQDTARVDAIRTIAKTSPKEAAEFALRQSGRISGFDLLPTQVMREWVKQDVETAVEWIYNGPVSTENRRKWVNALVTNLVNTDPRRAFDLAVKQPLPEFSSFMGEGINTGLEEDIIRRIAYQDLELAVELLPRVRKGRTQSSAFASVGDLFIDRGHSQKALDLGLRLPNEDQTHYFLVITPNWATIDPVGLVESIKDLPTKEIRSSVASVLSNRWYRKNFTDDQLDKLKQYLSDADREALEQQQ